MIVMKKFTVRPRLTHARQLCVGSVGQTEEHLFLGRLAETGALVNVDYDVRLPHVVAVFGKRGSGKSYTLGTFLEGLCTKERESSISRITRTRALLLFDTLGIFQWMDIPLDPESSQDVIREQASAQRGWDLGSEPLDVRVWVPYGTEAPVRGRDFEQFSVNCADFTASDWGYLLGVDILQDRMGQLLNDAYEKVVHEGWSDTSVAHAPSPTYAIEDLMDCIQGDSELVATYHGETRRAVLQQLTVYWRNPLFRPKRRPPGIPVSTGQALVSQDLQQPTDIEIEGTSLTDLLKPGQLSVIVMSRMSDELRFVVIMALIRKIMEARIETCEIEKNLRILPDLSDNERATMLEAVRTGLPPAWIAVDEAQNFLPTERKTAATDTLVRLVREGRNFGLSFILTTQQPSAIDQRIAAQVDTLVVHKLTVQSDIDYVRRNLKCGLPEQVKYANRVLPFDELLRTLDVGQAVVSNTEAPRSFIMDIRPRVSVHGGFGG